MAKPQELVLPFSLGINRFAPEIILGVESTPIPLRQLVNFRQLDASLRAIRKRVSEGSFPAKTYIAIDGYISGAGNVFWVYVITDDEIYQVGYSGSVFTLASLSTPYTFSTALTEAVDTAAWENAVYVASHEFNVLELKGSSVSEVDFQDLGTTVKAKHVLVADDRVLYGNLIQNGSKRPYRLIWSDLYNATKFELSESSEAGSYDVGFNRNVITGLTEQHGRINIFTQNSIVQARYVGITNGTYEFEPLYNGIGNLYHYAVVHVKEADFFIARDNFYILEGTNITPIGTPIWNVWNDVRKNPRETDIRGYFNEFDTEVYWSFVANGNHGTATDQLWDLCYNYKEQEWFLRKNISADFFQYDYDMALGKPWTDYPNGWSTYSQTWEELVDPITNENIELYINPTTGLETVNRVTFSPQGVACAIETHDFAFGSAYAEKEIDEIKVVFEGLVIQNTSFLISIGTRDSFNESVAWSTPQALNDTDDIISYFRKVNPGKLIRLRFTWTNGDTAYIERLVGIAMKFTTPIMHETDR